MVVSAIVDKDVEVEVRHSVTLGTEWPVVVTTGDLTMFLTVERARLVLEQLGHVLQGIADAETEGPLPEYFPVRA